MPGRDLIVIGASAGGIQALTELLRGLPADLPAAVLVVVHTSPTSPGVLPQILDRAGPLRAAHAADGEPLRPGRVYVAPPDHHLLVKPADTHGRPNPRRARKGKPARDESDAAIHRASPDDNDRGLPPLTLRIVRGPKENGFRPAVDPLFRTAARVGGARTVGVVLSGSLDDGTEGLALIKSYGGTALVQDPAEAHFPSMPASAIQYVEVDHVLPVAKIATALARLANQPLPEGASAMPQDAREADVAELGDASLLTGDLPVPPSGFTCPECGGALWELRAGELLKFRCHVGHAYSADALVAEQTRDLEASLWTALRALEESAGLRRRMAQRARRGTWPTIAEDYERQAEDAEARAALIRRTLMVEDPATETIRVERPPTPKWDSRLYGPNGKEGKGRPKSRRNESRPNGKSAPGATRGANPKTTRKQKPKRANGRQHR
jgi:two-component system chemotaxis response regulator CheB